MLRIALCQDIDQIRVAEAFRFGHNPLLLAPFVAQLLLDVVAGLLRGLLRSHELRNLLGDDRLAFEESTFRFPEQRLGFGRCLLGSHQGDAQVRGLGVACGSEETNTLEPNEATATLDGEGKNKGTKTSSISYRKSYEQASARTPLRLELRGSHRSVRSLQDLSLSKSR